MHAVYPVLSHDEISEIDNKLSCEVPLDYKNFLLHCSNGLSIFLNTLSFYGIRKKIDRDLENAWQPFSIISLNTIERIKDARTYDFFIGGYNWDGSLLYIDTKTNYVIRCSNKSVQPLNSWNNFEEMVTSEMKRIASLFDENGNEKDVDIPTIPN